jgi:peptidoglycan/LPS O-acetylase OafA/YrhL
MAAQDTPTTAFDRYLTVRRFGSLDGLRFFCIMAVIWHHAPFWVAMDGPAPFLTRGFLGVDFFFVLSGYLITTLLLREERQTGRFSLSGFYWRRILRILPIYFLLVSALGFYFIVVLGRWELLELLPFYYLFLSNFMVDDIPLLAPMWSLAVEEQFYMVWPLLLLVMSRKMVLPVLVILIVTNIVVITGFAGQGPVVGPLKFALFSTTYAPILLGAAVAVLMNTRAGFDALYRVFGNAIGMIASFVLLLIAVGTLPADLRGWPNMVLHLLMAGCLISIVCREDHTLNGVFRLRPLARVGEISYGIYLYHLVALDVALRVINGQDTASQWGVLILYTVFSIIIAEISFRTIERYFMGLRNKPWGKAREQS